MIAVTTCANDCRLFLYAIRITWPGERNNGSRCAIRIVTTKTYPSGPLKFFAKVSSAGVSQWKTQREGESLHLSLTLLDGYKHCPMRRLKYCYSLSDKILICNAMYPALAQMHFSWIWALRINSCSNKTLWRMGFSQGRMNLMIF